jgi:hypothetical protein
VIYMSETSSQDMMAQLQTLLQQVQQPATGQAISALSGWQAAQPTALNVQGAAVPVALQTPIGKVRVYFWLGPEAAASPEALMAALEQLAAAGIPIDAWDSGKSGWSGKSSGWNGSNHKRRW